MFLLYATCNLKYIDCDLCLTTLQNQNVQPGKQYHTEYGMEIVKSYNLCDKEIINNIYCHTFLSLQAVMYI